VWVGCGGGGGMGASLCASRHLAMSAGRRRPVCRSAADRQLESKHFLIKPNFRATRAADRGFGRCSSKAVNPSEWPILGVGAVELEGQLQRVLGREDKQRSLRTRSLLDTG
jgi:hypothetical protein